MIKMRFNKLFAYSRFSTILCVSLITAVLAFSIYTFFTSRWDMGLFGILGTGLPPLLKKQMIDRFIPTRYFLKLSIPVIALAVLSSPFLFGSVSHIPVPLQYFSFLYFSFYINSYFWILSDPEIILTVY